MMMLIFSIIVMRSYLSPRGLEGCSHPPPPPPLFFFFFFLPPDPPQIFAKFDLLPTDNHSEKQSAKKNINHSKFLESNWKHCSCLFQVIHKTNFDWHCIFHAVFFLSFTMTITNFKKSLSQDHAFSIGAKNYGDTFHWGHNDFSISFIFHWDHKCLFHWDYI